MLSKEKNPVHFIAIVLFILLFTYQASTEVVTEMTVFNIQSNKLYLLIIVCGIFIMVNALKFYSDRVVVMLIISTALGLLPLLYSDNTNNYLGNYLPLLISVAAYFICLQTKGDVAERFYRIILFTSLVIAFQVIYTEWNFFSALSFSNFNNVIIKGSMNIPIGSSNLIAAFLLPMMVFIFSYKRNFFSVSTLSICLYALILCRSKNALILLLALVLLMPLFKSVKFIYKDKSADLFLKLFSLSLVIVFFNFLFFLLIKLSNFVVTDLSFNYFSSIANPYLNKLDALSSGRVTIYIEQWNKFAQHFILGNGFGYTIGQTKSHNWILDLLVQKGLVGLMLYLFSIGIALKTAILYRKDTFSRAIFCSLVVIFLQGLFEISVFTIGIDLLIWSMAGLLMARARYIKQIKAQQEQTAR